WPDLITSPAGASHTICRSGTFTGAVNCTERRAFNSPRQRTITRKSPLCAGATTIESAACDLRTRQTLEPMPTTTASPIAMRPTLPAVMSLQSLLPVRRFDDHSSRQIGQQVWIALLQFVARGEGLQRSAQGGGCDGTGGGKR